MKSFRKGIELSNSFLKAEKTSKVSPENTNDDISGTEAANCGNTRMDRRTINEGGGQDDIQVSFPNTQFPFIPNVATTAKPPHGRGIKSKTSQSRKKPKEVVPIDEHVRGKRTRSKTSATQSSLRSLSTGAVSRKGEVSTGTNILTSNVAMVISEPPKHEASDKYNDRVDYEDSPCLDLSSDDNAHPDSAESQAMAKEDRPTQGSAILDFQHVEGAGVVTSVNEAMVMRSLAIEKGRIMEILSSPNIASGQPMHGTFMEPPFDTIQDSANIIHTSHGVEGNITSLLKADEPIFVNAKKENVGSILKPMSSAGLTSEVAKGLGTTNMPPSTAICSEQGASFVPTSVEGKGALNPWLAFERTFQNNTTEDVNREQARIFVESILNNAVRTVTSSNLEAVSSSFGIAKIAFQNAREVGLDTSMVESTFVAIFEIATKYLEGLTVNRRTLLEKELRASLVTYQTRLDEVLVARKVACEKKQALSNNLFQRKVRQEGILSEVLRAEKMLRLLKEDLACADTSVQELTYLEGLSSHTLASLIDEQKSIEDKIIHINAKLVPNEVQVEPQDSGSRYYFEGKRKKSVGAEATASISTAASGGLDSLHPALGHEMHSSSKPEQTGSKNVPNGGSGLPLEFPDESPSFIICGRDVIINKHLNTTDQGTKTFKQYGGPADSRQYQADSVSKGIFHQGNVGFARSGAGGFMEDDGK